MTAATTTETIRETTTSLCPECGIRRPNAWFAAGDDEPCASCWTRALVATLSADGFPTRAAAVGLLASIAADGLGLPEHDPTRIAAELGAQLVRAIAGNQDPESGWTPSEGEAREVAASVAWCQGLPTAVVEAIARCGELATDETPLAARVIAAVVAYDRLANAAGLNREEAASELEHLPALDPLVIAALADVVTMAESLVADEDDLEDDERDAWEAHNRADAASSPTLRETRRRFWASFDGS